MNFQRREVLQIKLPERQKEEKMLKTIIAGILGILGLLLFVVSKAIFTELPTNSEFAWVFAVCSMTGLAIVIAAVSMVGCRFSPV